MSSYASKLSSCLSGYGSNSSKIKSVNAQVKKLRAKTGKLEKRIARAQSVLDASSEELSENTDVGIMSLLTGKASFDDIDSRAYLLNKVVESQKVEIKDANAEKAKVQKKIDKLEKSVKKQKAAKKKLIDKGNEVAYKLEEKASMMRSHDQAAVDAVSGLDTSVKGVSAAIASAKGQQASHASARKSALSVLSRWYDLSDSLSGTSGGLTFGVGYDFDLSEEKFVKKWGDAIDKFYADFSAQAGFTAPLSGHGKEMAKSAYKHKIDPRLCAAVSIVESSGGQYCIKSCNAWGWGAADSDPYGGASSWSSWEDAIESWHADIDGSKTGMADAGSVGELGEIYCSSKDWAAKVTQYMEKIESFAE